MTERASGKGPTQEELRGARALLGEELHPFDMEQARRCERIAIALSDAYERGRRDGIEETANKCQEVAEKKGHVSGGKKCQYAEAVRALSAGHGREDK